MEEVDELDLESILRELEEEEEDEDKDEMKENDVSWIKDLKAGDSSKLDKTLKVKVLINLLKKNLVTMKS